MLKYSPVIKEGIPKLKRDLKSIQVIGLLK